jgi:glycine cleavage system H lipoate-binding protein
MAEFPMAETEAKYWVKDMGETARLGLEPDFAESLEGDWVAVELAAEGTTVRIAESFGFITTHLRTYDLRAPFAFRIVSVNKPAIENPALVRLSPMGGGWLLEIRKIDTALV